MIKKIRYWIIRKLAGDVLNSNGRLLAKNLYLHGQINVLKNEIDDFKRQVNDLNVMVNTGRRLQEDDLQYRTNIGRLRVNIYELWSKCPSDQRPALSDMLLLRDRDVEEWAKQYQLTV